MGIFFQQIRSDKFCRTHFKSCWKSRAVIRVFSGTNKIRLAAVNTDLEKSTFVAKKNFWSICFCQTRSNRFCTTRFGSFKRIFSISLHISLLRCRFPAVNDYSCFKLMFLLCPTFSNKVPTYCRINIVNNVQQVGVVFVG